MEDPESLVDELLKYADFNADGKVRIIRERTVFYCLIGIRSVFLKDGVFGHLYKLMNLSMRSYWPIKVMSRKYADHVDIYLHWIEFPIKVYLLMKNKV